MFLPIVWFIHFYFIYMSRLSLEVALSQSPIKYELNWSIEQHKQNNNMSKRNQPFLHIADVSKSKQLPSKLFKMDLCVKHVESFILFQRTERLALKTWTYFSWLISAELHGLLPKRCQQ